MVAETSKFLWKGPTIALDDVLIQPFLCIIAQGVRTISSNYPAAGEESKGIVIDN